MAARALAGIEAAHAQRNLLIAAARDVYVGHHRYQHTPLEQSFFVNMTCLVPTENKEIAGPMRLDLRAVLREFLDFREQVVRRRFEFELAELERRIHILEGFAIVFDGLDEAIRIMSTVLTTGEERFKEAESLAWERKLLKEPWA